jgi:hypothetical protein
MHLFNILGNSQPNQQRLILLSYVGPDLRGQVAKTFDPGLRVSVHCLKSKRKGTRWISEDGDASPVWALHPPSGPQHLRLPCCITVQASMAWNQRPYPRGSVGRRCVNDLEPLSGTRPAIAPTRSWEIRLTPLEVPGRRTDGLETRNA